MKTVRTQGPESKAVMAVYKEVSASVQAISFHSPLRMTVDYPQARGARPSIDTSQNIFSACNVSHHFYILVTQHVRVLSFSQSLARLIAFELAAVAGPNRRALFSCSGLSILLRAERLLHALPTAVSVRLEVPTTGNMVSCFSYIHHICITSFI